MMRFLQLLLMTVKWFFIVILLFFLSLFFREQEIPSFILRPVLERCTPHGLLINVDTVAFGFLHGVRIVNLKVFETSAETVEPMASASSIVIDILQRRIDIDALHYPRLPSGYYAPGNQERNEPVRMTLPEVPRFSLVLTRPDILAVRPARVVADVELASNVLMVDRIRLDWPDLEDRMSLDGFCKVDLAQQEIEGEVKGLAKQYLIRPLLVAIDIPVSLPYIDAFTEVQGAVPVTCGWHVDLVNNDFDLDLDLHPKMGKYNGVPMKKVDGKLRIHSYTRGKSLNYRVTVGPLVGLGPANESLDGMVVIEGVDGQNKVSVMATSSLAVASLLKIGGFTGEYVADDVIGKSECDLVFTFPRTMGSDLSQLNGSGHIRIHDGQLMRMKGFAGLMDLLADKIPGFSMITDSTQASGDYVIHNGVLQTDNILIEGSVFSLKMYGQEDFVNDTMDFIVRVQFAQEESLSGKILHPLTWPFTKLLLEFRMTGSGEHPQWEYLSVIDRVMEAIQ